MVVGSLFSGIGGFDLGLERAGMRVVWQCESSEFCRRVLAQHWPETPCYHDVAEIRGDRVAAVDVLCGGFPCQDISLLWKGEGLAGKRSGLWLEFARLIRELRPQYVIVENVSALLARGLGRVLGDLAALGYDAEWDCLPASAFGAPHRRDRIWVVAYPGGSRRWENTGGASLDESANEGRPAQDDHIVDGHGKGRRAWDVADTDEKRWARWSRHIGEVGRAQPADGGNWWSVEPNVGRVAYGVPQRMDRLAALGNSLVPQIAEWLGRRICQYENAQGEVMT